MQQETSAISNIMFSVCMQKKRITSANCVTIQQHNQRVCRDTLRRFMRKSATINVRIVIIKQYKQEICPFTSRQFTKKSETRNVLYVLLMRQDQEICLSMRKSVMINVRIVTIYAAATSGNVSSHIKARHEKIRDKKCPYFDYATSDRGNLSKHIKKPCIKKLCDKNVRIAIIPQL
jgi:hypothetical protein